MLRGRPFARRHGSVAGGIITPDKVTSATKRFWHDAQDNATITVATGASAWTDKFGNGYDVAQVTGANQPTVSAAAFGGRQSLRFTAASSQELIFTHATKVNDFAGGTDIAHEWWFVLQVASVTGVHVFGEVDSTVSQTTYHINLTNGAVWTLERRDGVGADTFRAQTGAIPAVGVPLILRARYTGTDAAWRANGVNLTTAGSSDTGTLAIDRLIYGSFGNGALAHLSFYDGYMGESIGFTGTLNASEALALENGLKLKWGIVF